jgi:cobalt-zinc-cadmium efflux system outer membrane protein
MGSARLLRALVIVASARPLHAQPAAVDALLASPPALVSWLEEHSAEVRAARQRSVQAAEDLGQSRVLPNPALELGLGNIPLGQTNPPGLGFSDTVNFTVGLTEMIEIGKRGPRIRGAELRAQAAGEDARAALGGRAADARAALGRTAWLVVRQRALEQNLRQTRELVDIETRRRDAGDISDAELGRIVLDADAVQMDVDHNRTELSSALSDCRAVMAAPCATDDVDDGTLERGGIVPDALPDVDVALAGRADLRSLDLNRRAAGEDAELARHRAIPDPTVGLVYAHDQFLVSGNLGNYLGVSVTVPLPIFDTGAHDAAKAEARAGELAEQSRGASLEVRAAIDGLIERRRWLASAIARLHAESIPRSLDVVAATRKAYDTGHVSLSDLILVERTHRELVIKALDLEFELFCARSELRHALGLDAARPAKEPS